MKNYPRRVVVREDFNSRGMSCNYFQQDNPNDKWRLHLADGSLVDDPAWVRTNELAEELIRQQIWIELLPKEIISYMGKNAW